MTRPPPRQFALELAFEPGRGLADFLRTSSNARALDLALGWREWPSISALIDGPSGSGKTHLARAWAGEGGGAFLSGPALRDTAAILDRLAERPLVAIDDADRIAAPEVLFHLYQHLAARDGRLLATASAPLAAWDLSLDDLRSRLATSATARIEPPDDALLQALLVKQLDDRRLEAAPEVVAYAALRLERTHKAAREFVRLLDQLSLRARRPITILLARDALAEMALGERSDVGDEAS